jgi:hypothetical protein
LSEAVAMFRLDEGAEAADKPAAGAVRVARLRLASVRN